MNWALAALAAMVGYLFGSVSFARVVFARLAPGEEPLKLRTPTVDGKAELVSHAVGGTNVMVRFGPKWGMAVTALDASKAFIPTLALGLLYPDEPYNLLCAVFVLIGHLWPVWYGFEGGGGNSCILGMLLAISPLALVVTHAGGYLIGRLVPMFAYLAGVALTIPWFAWRDGVPSPEFWFGIAITIIYFLGQLPEVIAARRLTAAGHKLDIEYTMRTMRSAAKTGKPGAEIATEHVAEAAGDAGSEAVTQGSAGAAPNADSRDAT